MENRGSPRNHKFAILFAIAAATGAVAFLVSRDRVDPDEHVRDGPVATAPVATPEVTEPTIAEPTPSPVTEQPTELAETEVLPAAPPDVRDTEIAAAKPKTTRTGRRAVKAPRAEAPAPAEDVTAESTEPETAQTEQATEDEALAEQPLPEGDATDNDALVMPEPQRAEIVFREKLAWLKPQSIEVRVDGRRVLADSDGSSLRSTSAFPIGALTAGKHRVDVALKLQGDSTAFSYMKGYTFTMKRGADVQVAGPSRIVIQAEAKDRLAADWKDRMTLQIGLEPTSPAMPGS